MPLSVDARHACSLQSCCCRICQMPPVLNASLLVFCQLGYWEQTTSGNNLLFNIAGAERVSASASCCGRALEGGEWRDQVCRIQELPEDSGSSTGASLTNTRERCASSRGIGGWLDSCASVLPGPMYISLQMQTPCQNSPRLLEWTLLQINLKCTTCARIDNHYQMSPRGPESQDSDPAGHCKTLTVRQKSNNVANCSSVEVLGGTDSGGV